MALSVVDYQAALCDPDYHRYLMFGSVDAMRERAAGRPLLPHETQGVLPWPQREMVDRVERAISDAAGEVITIRSARQTGKNEVEAFMEARALSIFRGYAGRVWVRTAPTYRPQIVNSRLRLEMHLSTDPLVRGRWRKREGFIFESGMAQIQFLSGGLTANVIGATASIALSVDEAHKMDQGKFEEDLAPFTASTNAPTVLWGVAADGLDLLEEYVEYNQVLDKKRPPHRRLSLEYPASVWCELWPAYAAHYEARVAKLGADHPVIRTQYDLVAQPSMGAYLNEAQRATLFSGKHPRLSAPRDGMRYAIVVDIGGESEVAVDSIAIALEPGRDYTMGWVLEYDPRASLHPYPEVRIVNGWWWVGRPHGRVATDIIRLAKHWRAQRGAIDARGVGEAVAMAVRRELPAIKAYKASAADVSVDCYDLQARLNCGTVKFWRADPAVDKELREMQAESRHTRYEIEGHDQMRLTKPTGRGSTNLHIDGLKALTYLHRGVPKMAERMML